MPQVGIDQYWYARLKAWVKSGIRPSMKKICEEALANYQRKLEDEKDTWEFYQEKAKEKTEERESKDDD